MLTEKHYINGISALDRMKYSIVYNKKILFDTVCANLAHKLLNSEYSADLKEEQKEKLNNIINK